LARTPAPVSADLHIHTTVSDSSDTFEQVARQALEQGLDLIAFTNHDTLKGLAEALALQERYPLTIIGGVEVSACDSASGKKIHILGLGFTSEHAPAVRALCAPTLERRHATTLWQMEQLILSGYHLDPEQLHHLSQDSTGPYKQHLMAALTSEPFGSRSYTELYSKLFKRGGICSRDIEYVDARDAVAAIKQDGGYAVLAHPGQLDSYEFVEQLAEQGLDGIEKYHHSHTAQDWRTVDQLAHDHNLFRTGGSDYHGSYGEVPHLGATRITLPADHVLLRHL
jgi:predicted metal-dependent phosphoesterase TrpH